MKNFSRIRIKECGGNNCSIDNCRKHEGRNAAMGGFVYEYVESEQY